MRTIYLIAGILALNTSAAFAAEHKDTMGNGDGRGAIAPVEVADDANIPVTGTIRGATSTKSKTVKVDYLNGTDGKVAYGKQSKLKIKGTATQKSKLPKNGSGQAPPPGQKYANYTNTNEDLGKGSKAFLCGRGQNQRLVSTNGQQEQTRRLPPNTEDPSLFLFPESGTNVNLKQAQGNAVIGLLQWSAREIFGFLGTTVRDYYAVKAGENKANGVRPTSLWYKSNNKQVNGCEEITILGGAGTGGAGQPADT